MRAITVGFACNNACVFCAQGDLRAARAVDGGPPVPASRRTRSTAPSRPSARRDGRLHGWRAHPLRRAARLDPRRRRAGRGRRDRLADQRPSPRLPRLRPRAARGLAPAPARRLPPRLHRAHARLAHRTEGSFAQTVLGLRHARAERIPVGRHRGGDPVQLPPPGRDRPRRPRRGGLGLHFASAFAARPRRPGLGPPRARRGDGRAPPAARRRRGRAPRPARPGGRDATLPRSFSPASARWSLPPRPASG